MVQESAQYAATRQKAAPGPATTHIAVLWWLAGIGVAFGLILSALTVSDAQTAADQIRIGRSAQVNPWPAILATPAYTLGVLSAVAAIVGIGRASWRVRGGVWGGG